MTQPAPKGDRTISAANAFAYAGIGIRLTTVRPRAALRCAPEEVR